MPTPSSSSALRVAAGLLVLQGLAALVFAALEVGQVRSSRPVVGVGVVLLGVGYAGVLVVLARGVSRARRWSRAPAVVTQLILLLLGWSFREPPTTAVGVAMGAVALGALVGLLVPDSTRRFVGPPGD